MIRSLATVAPDWVVMAPTVRLAAVRIVEAAACVWFVTSGTSTGAGPLEITSATALPGATDAPAAGVWLMIRSFATVALDCVVIAPTVRLAAVSVVDAAACVWLVTPGTTTGGGPLEITSATALPGATDAPAAGVWLMIRSFATVALDCVVIAPTVRPAAVSVADAAACV